MLDSNVSTSLGQARLLSVSEEALQFGEGGRMLGLLTLPGRARPDEKRPVFVFLNAGLLHRVGPLRMTVRLARELGEMGFAALRVDLAGTGDTPARAGLTNQQSVAADFTGIQNILLSRLGPVPIVLVGLCSGADNAIRLALDNPRITGMVLLDPICFKDDGFGLRAGTDAVFDKFAHPLHHLAVLKRRGTKFLHGKRRVDPLSLRDLPDREQMQEAFRSLRGRNGHILSIFTQYAVPYYNRQGQQERVLAVEGYRDVATEVFWPDVDHTYMLEVHRLRLIERIKNWAETHFD